MCYFINNYWYVYGICISRPLNLIIKLMGKVEQGDLTVSSPISGKMK